ncbi:hypothetical protein [Paraliobacillus sp. JSM ZJ581]|uniref:hypothetical protein n=1 Tax=Paraliobacillus sp. JSM ZJ581 TaxID=3342118 RepID=UPI0035A8BB4F
MKNFKFHIAIVFFILLIGITIFIIKKPTDESTRTHLETPLEKFIWEDMLNANKLLKTHYQTSDTDYSLSESLGLWLEYAVKSDNRALFDLGYQQLTEYFLSKQGSIHWRVLLNGEVTESVNAYVDDLRIIQALLDATNQWDERTYRKTAKHISQTLIEKGTYNQYFVDFYDWKYDAKSSALSTAYLDLKTLERLNHLEWMDHELYQKMYRIAKQTAVKSNPLFPTRYLIDKNEFVYDDKVNMIEQTYTAYHLGKINMDTNDFLSFLEQEFDTHHKLFGQYDSTTLKPAVTYESPALYGIAIQYALVEKNDSFALKLYDRLQSFRVKQSPFKGAYMDQTTNNTHIFDNLVPLIAERSLREHELIR